MGTRSALLAALAAAALAGCGGGNSEQAVIATPPGEDLIKLSSPQIKNGGKIPVELTCDGKTPAAPTIVWREVRQDAVELVMTMVDPDASDEGFTHWTVYRLPAAGGSGLAPDGQFPAGVLEGKNSAGNPGWAPPCPPKGDGPHRYVFTMYGIPEGTALPAGASPAEVQAVTDTAVSYGRFTGTYERK